MRNFFGFEKGVNLGGWLSQSYLEKEHLESFITERDIQLIASLGIDHVRLPIDYLLIENPDGTMIEWGYDYIDRCVHWCEKHKLNVILDLHKTAGYSFNDLDNSSSFFSSKSLQERFFSLWDKLSQRYGKYNFIAFDLLNEITDPNVSSAWNKIAEETVRRIRRYAPNTWILIGGTCYSSINTLKDILLPPDDKIVYSFHFYEPYIFTHQGATWDKNMTSDFRIGYPLTAGEYINSSKHQLNGNCLGIFHKVDSSVTTTEILNALFTEAVSIAESRNVPLYCGEYGVINLAEPEDALFWHQDIHFIFEKYGIGRALWNYKHMDFGLIDDHYQNIFNQLISLL